MVDTTTYITQNQGLTGNSTHVDRLQTIVAMHKQWPTEAIHSNVIIQLHLDGIVKELLNDLELATQKFGKLRARN